MLAPIMAPSGRRTATPVDKESAGRATPTVQRQSSTPVHPIPQLQGPFDESIIEANFGPDSEWVVDIDGQSRRRELLENAIYERLCGRKWRQRPGERQAQHLSVWCILISQLTESHCRYHPLWKLISQACFGVYLLASGLAKSDVEVVRIMQGYVDEFDGFLERTTDDFHLIQVDVQARIDYLRVPLRHVEVFDEMLMDLDFRSSIVDYNKKIEFAITRFTAAVNDSLKDMHKGKEAIGALWHYLRQVTQECSPDATNLAAIYHAMIGNVEAWNFALSKLYKRGNILIMALSHLGAAVAEMQRRVQVAGRKDKVS